MNAPKPPTREIVIHERIGELRAALFDRDRIVELRLERWSTHESRVRWGQIYAGRVTAIDGRIGGAFVDLGVGEPAFAPFGREREAELRVGAGVAVRVVREAEGGKGPALAYEGLAPQGPCPRLLEDATPWQGWPGEPREADEDEIDRIDAAFEAALQTEVPIAGGGRLTIERTRALTAVDVDSANRETGGTEAPGMVGENFGVIEFDIAAHATALKDNDPGDTAADLWTDLMVALGTDKTLGGLCDDLVSAGHEASETQGGKRFAMRQQSFRIHYRTTRWAPATAPA